MVKIIKNKDIPKQIIYRGHVYKSGSHYGNLENARRDQRFFLAKNEDLRLVLRKFYVEAFPGARPQPAYVLYRREVV
jgi:hypothetical protein